MKKPKMLPKEKIDFTQVIRLCQEEIDEIARGEDQDSDTRHYIYEAAMEAVFGEDCWEWINFHYKLNYQDN